MNRRQKRERCRKITGHQIRQRKWKKLRAEWDHTAMALAAEMLGAYARQEVLQYTEQIGRLERMWCRRKRLWVRLVVFLSLIGATPVLFVALAVGVLYGIATAVRCSFIRSRVMAWLSDADCLIAITTGEGIPAAEN